MQIHDLVWDAGGTLFNTYPAITRAFVLALQEFGATICETRVLHLARRSTQHAIDTLASDVGVPSATLETAFRRYYNTMGPETQPPFPGVIDVCTTIRLRGGRNFVVTHRKRGSLEALLKAHNMDHFFSDNITGEDPFPRKPNPAALEALIARHTLVPATTLFIGDRVLDLEAGRAAGMRTCLFNSGPLEGDVPDIDLCITTFDTLLNMLRE